MTEIIKVNYDSEQPTVLGRDLHEALGIKSKYADWFKNTCAYGFEEGKDYVAFSKILENGGRTKNHQITIPMAKEICMIQRTEIGKSIVSILWQLKISGTIPMPLWRELCKSLTKSLMKRKCS